MNEAATRHPNRQPVKLLKSGVPAAEAGRKGGIASGVSRRQRGRKQLEHIVMQSRNGAAAVALLRETEARDRAEDRRRQAEEHRRERDVEDLEQRADKARMEAIGWDRYGERLVDQLHHGEAECDELKARVEKLRRLEAELRRSIAAEAEAADMELVDDDEGCPREEGEERTGPQGRGSRPGLRHGWNSQG